MTTPLVILPKDPNTESEVIINVDDISNVEYSGNLREPEKAELEIEMKTETTYEYKGHIAVDLWNKLSRISERL